MNSGPSTDQSESDDQVPVSVVPMRHETKRVILTMGGKGGVGKTSFMLALAEWFVGKEVTLKLLDLDTENKTRGSLSHYFGRATKKVNIHTAAGLDSFIDYIDDGTSIVLADMGASSGQVTYDWFDSMFEDVQALGVSFTAIGIVTPDPASVESVLSWAAHLQNRVQYIVVENAITYPADFTYWRETEQSQVFQKVLHPVVLSMDFRLPELENPARQHGITLGAIAERRHDVDELRRASLVLRAQSYRRRLFQEIENAKHLLLP
jgi:MinD-like ATPase involved in chromosome partitioning or flagellar assembly